MLRAAIVTLVVLVVVDAAWLALVAAPMFATVLGPLLKPRPDLAAAALFYVIYAGGLLVLAARPGIERGSTAHAAGLGAVVGLTAYATFDLTSLAILERWTWGLALADMAWGTALSALSAAAGCAVGLRPRSVA